MEQQRSEIAIIGGTGLTSIEGLEIIHREMVKTPFGTPSGPLLHGSLFGKRVIFLARHGYRHTIPPHRVNYRANILALKQLGVKRVIAVAAVGGISEESYPGRIVIPDQIIDYTHSRGHTYFEDNLSHVTHIDFTHPYTRELRQMLIDAGHSAGLDPLESGVYGATQGPRLETAAEITKMERDGSTLVGMTGMPEAALAREQELEYATLAVVANWAAGKNGDEITMEEIDATLRGGMERVRQLLRNLFKQMP